MSMASDPVEMASDDSALFISPRRITAPLPCSFSMDPKAMSKAACLSLSILSNLTLLCSFRLRRILT